MRRRLPWLILPALAALPLGLAFAAATLSASPASVVFPTQCNYADANPSTVTVTNKGDAEALNVSVSLSPSDLAPVFPLGGELAVPTLTPGEQLQFQSGFSPVHHGTTKATAVVRYFVPQPTPSDTSHGGGPPSTPSPPPPQEESTVVPLSGSAIDRFIDANPPGLNFGTVRLGKKGPDETVTIFDDGDDPLHIQNLSIRGRHPNDFSIVTEPGSIVTDGHPVKVVLVFKPKESGARAAELVIRSDSCGTPELVVQLAGIAVEPEINVDPKSVDFGTRPLGREVSKRISVVDKGGAPLIVRDVQMVPAVPGSDDVKSFTLTGKPKLPKTLQPGGSFVLTAGFTATDIGPRNVLLKITSNDAHHKTVTVPIFGAGGTIASPTPSASAAPPPKSKGSGFHLPIGPYLPVLGVALGIAAFFGVLVLARRLRGIPD